MDWSDLRHGNAVASIQGGFSSSQQLQSFFSDELVVRLELRISTLVVTPSSPYDPWWPSSAEWTADRTVFFRLSQMHQLVDLIFFALLRDGRVIGGGADDLPEFLARSVSSYVLEFAAVACNDAEYVVNVDLRLLDHEQPAAALELATEELTVASPSDIARLLRKVAYKKNGMEELVRETACPICLQDFGVEEEVYLTRCGHPFHLRCIQRWTELNAMCPLCRTATSSKREEC